MKVLTLEDIANLTVSELVELNLPRMNGKSKSIIDIIRKSIDESYNND